MKQNETGGRDWKLRDTKGYNIGPFLPRRGISLQNGSVVTRWAVMSGCIQVFQRHPQGRQDRLIPAPGGFSMFLLESIPKKH